MDNARVRASVAYCSLAGGNCGSDAQPMSEHDSVEEGRAGRLPSRERRSRRDEDIVTDHQSIPLERTDQRVCPWCQSTDTRLVQRGFIGPTDERDQYFTCASCNRLTYEIVSRTVRDMKLGQFRAGGTFRDSAHQTKYTISRVLKVGFNELLLYVKPVVPSAANGARSRTRD